MSRRQLPAWGLEQFLEWARGSGHETTFCLTRVEIRELWRRLGLGARKVTALDVLGHPGRLSDDHSGEHVDALYVACHMLPVGFRGCETGGEVWANLPDGMGAGERDALVADLRAWLDGPPACSPEPRKGPGGPTGGGA